MASANMTPTNVEIPSMRSLDRRPLKMPTQKAQKKVTQRLTAPLLQLQAGTTASTLHHIIIKLARQS